MNETTIKSPEAAVAETPIRFHNKLLVTQVAKAPIDLCFKVIADEWAGWYPNLSKVELISPGEPHPTGLGAVRGLWRREESLDGKGDSYAARKTALDGPPQIVDVCNHYWPPYCYGYKVIGFEPVGVMEHSQVLFYLRPCDEGTEILMHSTNALTHEIPDPEIAERGTRLALLHMRLIVAVCVTVAELRAQA